MYTQDEQNRDFAVPYVKKRDGKYYILKEGTSEDWQEVSKEVAEDYICKEITGETREVLSKKHKTAIFPQYPINFEKAGGGDDGPEQFGM